MLTDGVSVQPDFLERFFPSVLGGVEGDEHSESASLLACTCVLDLTIL